MSEENLNQLASRAATRRLLPFLWLLFVGSGCAALIYEIVWLQLLQLVIGSSAISLGVLLGTFMGGMCLGSLALARVIPVRQHPLRVYALLELGSASSGSSFCSLCRLSPSFMRLTPGMVFREFCCAGRLAQCVCCRPRC